MPFLALKSIRHVYGNFLTQQVERESPASAVYIHRGVRSLTTVIHISDNYYNVL